MQQMISGGAVGEQSSAGVGMGMSSGAGQKRLGPGTLRMRGIPFRSTVDDVFRFFAGFQVSTPHAMRTNRSPRRDRLDTPHNHARFLGRLLAPPTLSSPSRCCSMWTQIMPGGVTLGQRDGRATGDCYVTFASPSEAHRAMAMNNKHMVCKPTTPLSTANTRRVCTLKNFKRWSSPLCSEEHGAALSDYLAQDVDTSVLVLSALPGYPLCRTLQCVKGNAGAGSTGR